MVSNGFFCVCAMIHNRVQEMKAVEPRAEVYFQQDEIQDTAGEYHGE